MGTVRFQVVKKDGQDFVQEIHKVVVHKFNLGDVEDPDLYAAQPIYEWQQSEQGKFVMAHSIGQPEWQRHMDRMWMGYAYIIIAELELKKLSEFYLKWGKPK